MKKRILIALVVVSSLSLSGSSPEKDQGINRDIINSLDEFKSSLDSIKIILDVQ